jgi:hypothetical protein
MVLLCIVLNDMGLIMVFSRCPAVAQSASEIRFGNLFLVVILPVVECMWPSDVTSLSLGTLVEMWIVYRGHKFLAACGFYLVEILT